MKHLQKWLAIAACGIILFHASSCVNNKQKTDDTKTDNNLIAEAQWKDATTISFHYGDSSLPPDYHRSYTITMTAESIVFTINSYGDILLEKTYANTPDRFSKAKETLKACGIGKKERTEDKGCAGGTSERFSLSNEGKEIFDAYAYYCEGISGTLSVEQKNLSSVMASFVPEDISKLINSTMEQEDENEYEDYNEETNETEPIEITEQ